jgi:tetratricopeptide (TPR) repeat protein
LEQVLKNGTADPDPYIELSEIYQREDRLPLAIRVLERAVEILPDDPRIVWEYEEARLKRSYQRLQDADRLATQRGDPASLEELERCQIEWANRRLEVSRARLQRNPSEHHLCLVMAAALRELGRSSEAVVALEPALADPREGPMAWLRRGECLEDLHRPLDALVAYRAAGMRRAVSIPVPTRIDALRLAVSLATRLGLAASAARYLSALEAIAPDLPELESLRQQVRNAPPVVELDDAPSDR